MLLDTIIARPTHQEQLIRFYYQGALTISFHQCLSDTDQRLTLWLNSNNNVLFYVLFLQIGAHSLLQNKEKDTVKANVCEHAHTYTHTVNSTPWKGEISKMIKKMWVCLMIYLFKGDCFRQMAQHQKKKIWPSKCIHTEGRQWTEVSEEEQSWWAGV